MNNNLAVITRIRMTDGYFPPMTWQLKHYITLIHPWRVKGISELEKTVEIIPASSSPQMSPYQPRAFYFILFSLFTFCLFLQRNYGAPLSRCGYHSYDYNTVAKGNHIFFFLPPQWTSSLLANVKDQLPLWYDLRLVQWRLMEKLDAQRRTRRR